MTYIPNPRYRRPAPLEIPLGEPVVIPARTLLVARDGIGREVGYLVEEGVGSQHPGVRDK